MLTRTPLLLMIAIGLQAQPPSDPAQILLSAQEKLTNFLHGLPKYMCTETVERVQYDPPITYHGDACDRGREKPAVHVNTSDRLRLDVTNTAVGEIFSWVNSTKFSDRDLLEIVNEGAISSGSFGAFLESIFQLDGPATFTYHGDITERGRILSEFGFRVPREQSHYRFGKGPGQFFTAYDGTFLIDPKTSDLVRLELKSEQFPSDTHLCYSTTTLEYKPRRIGDIEFLFPIAARYHIFHQDGVESENTMSFSNCHEFLGQSTVSFDPPSEGGAKHSDAGSPALVIPPGIEFKAALAQSIDTNAAAVGDPIEAKLTTAIELRQTGNPAKILVPNGAVVGARIVRLRWFYGSQTRLVLGVKLETVQVDGVTMRLDATPVLAQRFQKAKPGTLQPNVNLGNLLSLADRSASIEYKNVRKPFVIHAGLEFPWVTAEEQ